MSCPHIIAHPLNLHQFQKYFESAYFSSKTFAQWRSCYPTSNCRIWGGANCTLGYWKFSDLQMKDIRKQLSYSRKACYFEEKEGDSGQSDSSLHVQTLRNFPVDKLYDEVVMIRFDCTLLLDAGNNYCFLLQRSLSTIKYLYNTGARVILVSSWGQPSDPVHISNELIADRLSSLLQLRIVPANGAGSVTEFQTKEMENADILLLDNLSKFKEEVANCSVFSQKLGLGVSLFVNDAFSLSHKILASTVGITRHCHASVAGFLFEEELCQLMKIIDNSTRPYAAIIGGSNFSRKAKALHLLASQCDELIFVGNLAFQIMNGLEISVPSSFIEQDAILEVSRLIEVAKAKKIAIYFPKDFWCLNNSNQKLVGIFPSNKITNGLTPIELGPISLKEISDLLSNCKKVLSIGSVSFDSLKNERVRVPSLGLILERISRSGCNVILIGNAACQVIAEKISSSNQYTIFKNASVVWEFLSGRKLPAPLLPGIAALDRAYPYSLNWNDIFADPTQPLVVDIGSGNGLFILKMTQKWVNYNFIGLEINKKLVRRCLDSLLQTEIRNGYFISTNATTTFQSIFSNYPGKLALVAIQCPNPDFNREAHRWRMVQKVLVESITDLLVTNGKVFLQSDLEPVATRMKELFILHGKGKLVLDEDNGDCLKENPFGVRTDWEDHVLERGAPMFRIMLRKL